ncbi:MAG: response regulator transcription factor [Bryobacterales bacterium]
MNRPGILIADDHRIFAEGLRHILSPYCNVLGTVADGRELIEAAHTLKPELIVADISMPVLNGIDAVRRIRTKNADVKILFLTMHPDVTYATEAIAAGASGYVLKHSVTSELMTAVAAVLRGERYISPSLADKVEKSLVEVSTGRKRSISLSLSSRQREVLQLVAQGKSAKEIAELLFISTRTAEYHKQELRKKLGVASTAELVKQAVRLQLLDGEA